FHRPPAGLGLHEISQAHIKSMRMVMNSLKIFDCEPNNALLSNRSWNEAYCTAQVGQQYAVFFPDGGDVFLDVTPMQGKTLYIKWLDIRASAWFNQIKKTPFPENNQLRLVSPREEGYWAVVITAASKTGLQ
ncbi:MAG: hypothetical protein P1S60_20850, partial [Anaerolineae bacterium]|nr:hypothetical protein [Anaerolineae bacterium]